MSDLSRILSGFYLGSGEYYIVHHGAFIHSKLKGQLTISQLKKTLSWYATILEGIEIIYHAGSSGRN